MLKICAKNIFVQGFKYFPKTTNNSFNKSIIQKQLEKKYSLSSTLEKHSQQFNLFKMSKVTALPEVVFVLGGPGAGKGTQCKKIVDTYGYVHLSAGDLLREERTRPGSEFGELIENHITDGRIVPVAVTCSLLENAIEKHMKNFGKSKFLIDGFPRNQDNVDGWNSKMANKVNLQFVLFFDCNQQVCIDRCLKRGEAGSGRSDDNEETMRKRINTYNSDSLPIIDHYMNLNKVKRIDASLNADEVFEMVKNAFVQDDLKDGCGDH